MEKVVINGVEYAPTSPNGCRAVVVVDRGWIFAGDVHDDGGTHLTLKRAVWLFRWESIGFDGVLRNPEEADIRKMATDVVIPKGSEIFRCPVSDDWGIA